AEADLELGLLDHLRITGQYAALARRAGEKQRVLAAQGLEAPRLSDVGMTQEELWRWYFDERLRHLIPADLAAYARACDFADEAALEQAVLCELCFQGLQPRAMAPSAG